MGNHLTQTYYLFSRKTIAFIREMHQLNTFLINLLMGQMAKKCCQNAQFTGDFPSMRATEEGREFLQLQTKPKGEQERVLDRSVKSNANLSLHQAVSIKIFINDFEQQSSHNPKDPKIQSLLHTTKYNLYEKTEQSQESESLIPGAQVDDCHLSILRLPVMEAINRTPNPEDLFSLNLTRKEVNVFKSIFDNECSENFPEISRLCRMKRNQSAQ